MGRDILRAHVTLCWVRTQNLTQLIVDSDGGGLDWFKVSFLKWIFGDGNSPTHVNGAPHFSYVVFLTFLSFPLLGTMGRLNPWPLGRP